MNDHRADSVSILVPSGMLGAGFPEETIIQIHGIGPAGITYINPADDPRKQ